MCDFKTLTLFLSFVFVYSLIKKNKIQDAKDVLEKTLDIAPYCLEARKMMDELLREDSPGTLSRKRKTKERNVIFSLFFFHLLGNNFALIVLVTICYLDI